MSQCLTEEENNDRNISTSGWCCPGCWSQLSSHLLHHVTINFSQDDSGCGQHLRLEVPGLAQTAKADPAGGPDGEDGEGGVLQGDPPPGLWRELESPADEISDDIGVTDHDLVTVSGLAGL